MVQNTIIITHVICVCTFNLLAQNDCIFVLFHHYLSLCNLNPLFDFPKKKLHSVDNENQKYITLDSEKKKKNLSIFQWC
jgi:hypothetical protein